MALPEFRGMHAVARGRARVDPIADLLQDHETPRGQRVEVRRGLLVGGDACGLVEISVRFRALT